MHRHSMFVIFAVATLCSVVPASAGQPGAQAKRDHAACPQKRAAAAPRWNKPVMATTPIQVSAGGLPPPSLRRFAPDLLP